MVRFAAHLDRVLGWCAELGIQCVTDDDERRMSGFLLRQSAFSLPPGIAGIRDPDAGFCRTRWLRFVVFV
ncbi:hypothetical protein AB0J74_16920 [Asanoa sp. NPDC049573]|uniref:hypothetical protein n=1 Tax=Asanoa sp. NPDC049573 TaxID=3155396 RepID=UPI0034209172